MRIDATDLDCTQEGGSGETCGEDYDDNISMGQEDVKDVLSCVLEDSGTLLEELYQSGLDTAHDSTLQELNSMSGLTKQYGLSRLSEMLSQLADGQAHPAILKIQFSQKAGLSILRQTFQIINPPFLPLVIRKFQHNLTPRFVIQAHSKLLLRL